MSGHIVTEEQIEKMQAMRQDGMSCRQVALALGLSRSTVSNHTRERAKRKKSKRDEIRELLRTVAQCEKRGDTLYDVKIYYVRKRPDLVIYQQLDHRPTYTDMMLLCKTHGLNAVDFEDDRGTKMDDPIYHGTIYMPQSRTFPLARFTIRRLKGEVYLEDFFR